MGEGLVQRAFAGFGQDPHPEDWIKELGEETGAERAWWKGFGGIFAWRRLFRLLWVLALAAAVHRLAITTHQVVRIGRELVGLLRDLSHPVGRCACSLFVAVRALLWALSSVLWSLYKLRWRGRSQTWEDKPQPGRA